MLTFDTIFLLVLFYVLGAITYGFISSPDTSIRKGIAIMMFWPLFLLIFSIKNFHTGCFLVFKGLVQLTIGFYEAMKEVILK